MHAKFTELHVKDCCTSRRSMRALHRVGLETAVRRKIDFPVQPKTFPVTLK